MDVDRPAPRGRRQVAFADLTEDGRRRRVAGLRRADTGELLYASQMKLRLRGHLDLSRRVSES